MVMDWQISLHTSSTERKRKLYFGKGFTPEEEDAEVKRTLRFYEGMNNSGFYPRTQRLKVIHDDDGSRPPYFVNIYGRGLTV